MNATFEMTTEYGVTMTINLTNVLLEEICDVVSIHADNAFMNEFKREDIIEEMHDEYHDVYRLKQGIEIKLDSSDEDE